MEQLFLITNLLVMPFWLLMIFLPKWSVTQKIMRSPWVAAPVALIYAALIVPQIPSLFGELLNPTAASIAAGLGTVEGATVAWAHFLAFDLFVGRWVYLDSRTRDLNNLIISPIIFFVLMFGPLGFILYLGARQLLGMGSNPEIAAV